jgi:DNA polymerase-3 subunit alpha
MINLHCHSYYSPLDGYNSPEQIVLTAKSLGQSHVALTDHGQVAGLYEFWFAAREHGVIPILGDEVYFCPDVTVKGDDADTQHTLAEEEFDEIQESSARRKKKSRPNRHLILLAKNYTGYQNLLRLHTESNRPENYYYTNRIDFRLLEQFHEGLICTSSCVGGPISRAILDDDWDKAREYTERLYRIFGNDLYLEIQPHLLDKQIKVNAGIVQLSREYGIPIVATCDAHYARPEHHKYQDAVFCIGQSKGNKRVTIYDENRLRYGDSQYIMTTEECLSWFEKQGFPLDIAKVAIENTYVVADKVESYDLPSGLPLMPKFDTNGRDTEEYLMEQINIGFQKNIAPYIDPSRYQEYIDRIRMEYEVIRTGMNGRSFSDYFLVVSDMIRAAEEMGIQTGSGRGSVGGSLIARALGMTKIDPIEHGLYFERFLNKDRIGPPDVDSDFAEQLPVIRYLQQKYGFDNVARVKTYVYLQPKSAVLMAQKALGLPYNEVSNVTKYMSNDDLDIQYKNNPEFRKLCDTYPELLPLAKGLVGVIEHSGLHACAVIVSPEPLTLYTGLAYDKDDDVWVAEYEYTTLERIGLQKIDVLGLNTLAIIRETLNLIREHEGIEIDLQSIPVDDAKTFELFGEGRTSAIFQMEEGWIQQYLQQLKPHSIGELSFLTALGRPGAMQYIDVAIRRKHGLEPIEYYHPDFEPILRETYGVIAYQEQTMQIARDICGFTMSEADTLRKAIGKKIQSLLEAQRDKFIEGGIRNGYDRVMLERVWDDISKSADYSFNKSHSVAYATIGYWCGYLKAHYPVYYMTAVLNNTDKPERLVKYMDDARAMGIRILPPHINKSGKKFTVDKDGIRFGLSSIKFVGEKAVDEILSLRPFKSYADFEERVSSKVNSRMRESLLASGAFSELDGVQVDPNAQQQVTGMYISESPFTLYRDIVDRFSMSWEQVKNALPGQQIRLCATIGAVKKSKVKNRNSKQYGRAMAFMSVRMENADEPIRATIFPAVYEKVKDYVKEGGAVYIVAKVQKPLDVLVDNVMTLESMRQMLSMTNVN